LQLPEQQSLFALHVWLFCVHAVAPHDVPEQLRLQQSVATVQGVPWPPHIPIVHSCELVSHAPVQHSAAD
jgi:hypothetical protein